MTDPERVLIGMMELSTEGFKYVSIKESGYNKVDVFYNKGGSKFLFQAQMIPGFICIRDHLYCPYDESRKYLKSRVMNKNPYPEKEITEPKALISELIQEYCSKPVIVKTYDGNAPFYGIDCLGEWTMTIFDTRIDYYKWHVNSSIGTAYYDIDNPKFDPVETVLKILKEMIKQKRHGNS